MLCHKINYLLVALCIGLSINNTKGFNYYISTSMGNDSYNFMQARDRLTPWKSINKLNLKLNTIKPGDSILFKRGDVFYGSLFVSISGTSLYPICFGAYGEGENPQITGLTTISNWERNGAKIWEAQCIMGGNTVALLLINNILQQMGRYPNTEAENKGYMNIESHIGNSQITNKNLVSNINWSGGELVIRKNHWVIDRCQIENHTGNTISYKGGSSYEPKNGWGYFIQNHPQTLNKNGEWYYNQKTKKLLMFTNSSNPSSLVVQIPSIETLLTINNSKYINFKNINFNGSNSKTTLLSNSNSIGFKNCSIYNSGLNAIEAYNCSLISIENCSISNTNNNAIYFAQNCKLCSLINNKIINTGTISGAGQSGDGTYTAINVEGYSIRIEGNTIEKTGYIPISFRGDSTIIKNNYMSNFLITKDDGGGIYGGGSGLGCTKSINQKRSFIIGNTVLNGIGAPEGTNNDYDCANGIYLDDNASNIEINGNTVANMKSAGIFIHNSHKLKIENNTLFNNTKQLYIQYNDCALGMIRDIDFKNNVLCAKNSKQTLIQIFTTENDVDKFGVFNNNYYCQSSDQTIAIKVNNNDYMFKQWQELFKNDLNSKMIHINASIPENSIRFEYNNTKVQKLISTNHLYTDIKNNKYGRIIIIKPFSSIIVQKK